MCFRREKILKATAPDKVEYSSSWSSLWIVWQRPSWAIIHISLYQHITSDCDRSFIGIEYAYILTTSSQYKLSSQFLPVLVTPVTIWHVSIKEGWSLTICHVSMRSVVRKTTRVKGLTTLWVMFQCNIHSHQRVVKRLKGPGEVQKGRSGDWAGGKK